MTGIKIDAIKLKQIKWKQTQIGNISYFLVWKNVVSIDKTDNVIGENLYQKNFSGRCVFQIC